MFLHFEVKIYSRHDVFTSSGPSSSCVMKNFPSPVFFETPALEQSLVNFCCSGSSANFCSYQVFPVHPRQSEKVLAVGNSVGITIDSKLSFAAGFPALDESLANSLHKSAPAPWIMI